MFVSILTGFVAGAIHVVAGADHIVAMAPAGMRRPRTALRDGLAWGLGHSAGVIVLSCLAILAKDLINIQQMSSVAELMVGFSLLIVGAVAVSASLGVNIHAHNHSHETGRNHKHFHLHVLGNKLHGRHTHAATGLGVLHGLAGASHLIAVIPALALPLLGAIAYMAAYLIGSIIAMGVVVLGISLATNQASRRLSPFFLGGIGGLSIATGFFWIQKTTTQFI